MKKLIILLISAVLFISLSACSPKTADANSLISQAILAEPGLPAGTVYSSTATEGEGGYITDQLLTDMYGGDDCQPPSALGLTSEYAFFLADSQHPCEIDLFLCTSSSDAQDLALLCCRRLEMLKSVWKDNEKYAKYAESGKVTICGHGANRAVVLAFSSDPDAVISKVERCLG